MENWDKSYVLDMHVLISIPKGKNIFAYMEYDTTRTEFSELIFQ